MKLFLKILLIIFISLKPHLSFAIEESVTLKQKFKSVSFRVRQNLKRDAIYNFKSYLVRDMFDPMEWEWRKYWGRLGQHHVFPLEEHQVFPEDFLKEIMLLRKAVNGTTDREYSNLVTPLFLGDKQAISRFPKLKTHLTAKFETYYEDSQQELMFLERLLDNKPDKQIAEMLISFWLGQIAPYFSGAAKLYPYILAAKDPITPVIYRRYYYADAKMRAKILRFSGVIESRNLLPLIKQGLDDFNWEVRRQAEWRFNHAFGWLEDKPELAKMLIEKKNLWHFKPNHHGFSFYATKDWYQSFFNLVKAKKAYLHDLGKLKAVKNCPEEVIIANLEFLIKNLTTSYSKSPIFKKGRHGYFKYKDLKVIRSLLLNVKQKKYLRKFSPLLTLLLHDKAYWGARMSLSSSRPIKASYKSILGFSHYRNDKFLKRIVAALSIKDVEAWQKNIAPNFLTDLFLQSLLTEKKGGELNFPRKNYPLKITVIDKSNHEILATSDYVLNYGEETSVVLVSKNKNYSDKKLKLKVLFDREKWMYRVGVNIELKPHGLEVNNSIPVRGLGFDSSIPIAGSYEIFLSEPKETKWIFEHLL